VCQLHARRHIQAARTADDQQAFHPRLFHAFDNRLTALHALCVAGWGISLGVSEDDRQALADGRLLPVLPGWQLADLPVYAVTLRRGEQPAKVRHALDLLVTWFGGAGLEAVSGA
jgi:DNA-binding transcriptional LysR family regulator